MNIVHAGLFSTLLFLTSPGPRLRAQNKPPNPPPTIRVTSRLVFLEVTVVDKKGQPVVTGLTQKDFQITEDHRPQKIFSFEAPLTHTLSAQENRDSQPLLNIFSNRV